MMSPYTIFYGRYNSVLVINRIDSPILTLLTHRHLLLHSFSCAQFDFWPNDNSKIKKYFSLDFYLIWAIFRWFQIISYRFDSLLCRQFCLRQSKIGKIIGKNHFHSHRILIWRLCEFSPRKTFSSLQNLFGFAYVTLCFKYLRPIIWFV